MADLGFRIVDLPGRLTPNPALNRTGRYTASCWRVGAARRLDTLGLDMAARVTLDVFGKHMLVERSAGGWQTYLLGTDGKRSPVDLVVPSSLTEDELVQYFDDLYHEAATPRRPAVVRLS